jgi:hypothetical protein
MEAVGSETALFFLNPKTKQWIFSENDRKRLCPFAKDDHFLPSGAIIFRFMVRIMRFSLIRYSRNSLNCFSSSGERNSAARSLTR